MAFTGMPTRAYQYNQKGAKLKFMLPQEGVVLLPQSMFILKKAPHPNAAKLWIDFILSERGQTVAGQGRGADLGPCRVQEPVAGVCAEHRQPQDHQDRLGEHLHRGIAENARGVDPHLQPVTSTLPLA